MSDIKYIVGPRGAIMLPGGKGLRLPGEEIRFEDFRTQEQWLEHQRQQNIIPDGLKIKLEGLGVAIGNPDRKGLELTEQSIKQSAPNRDLEAELKAFKERQQAAGIDVQAERAREAAEAEAAKAGLDKAIADLEATVAKKPKNKGGRPKKVKPAIEVVSQTGVVEESVDLVAADKAFEQALEDAELGCPTDAEGLYEEDLELDGEVLDEDEL